jgi:hypothetical protein
MFSTAFDWGKMENDKTEDHKGLIPSTTDFVPGDHTGFERRQQGVCANQMVSAAAHAG